MSKPQKIQCRSCEEWKDRREFRLAENPTTCLDCINKTKEANKRKKFDEAVAAAVKEAVKKKPSKPRANLYLSSLAFATLRYLSGRKSHSEYVQNLLLEQFHSLDEEAQQAIQRLNEQ